MDRPNPDGWKGGSEDFTFVRTLDGHKSIRRYSDDETANEDTHRNARTTDNADLGVMDYDA